MSPSLPNAADAAHLFARWSAGAMTPAQKAAAALKAQQNADFPVRLWLIVLGVLACLILVNVLSHGARALRKYRALRQRLHLPRSEALRPVRNGMGGVRTSRIPVAGVSIFRITAFRWAIPFTSATLADAVINLGYITLLLVWSFIASKDASIAVWASRTAAIAVSQIPLLPVLSSKNNIIAVLTGISHERLMSLHRAAGRGLLLLLWLHGAGHYSTGTRFTTIKLQLGGVTLLCLTFTFLLSVVPVRKFAYEFFLVSHCILIGGFLVCGWFHAQQIEKVGYWFWTGMIFWAVDRVFRLVRIIYTTRPCSPRGSSEAVIELVSEDTVRVRLMRPITWNAGQHAFLNMGGISGNPLEMHPFTIATVSDPPSRENTEAGAARELSFIIRSRGGFTRRLRDQAEMSRQTGRNVVTAFIDGPYGNPPDLTTYSTAILVAGGSGVSYTISMFENLIQAARKGTSACQRVVFVWCIRDEAQIAWIYGQLLACLACVPEGLSVSVRIFVTRAPGFLGRLPFEQQRTNTMSSEKSAYNSKDKITLTSFAAVRIEYGRPVMDALIFEEASMSRGSVSVDVSGPENLISTVRAATRAPDVAGVGAIARGMPSITLHVEQFCM